MKIITAHGAKTQLSRYLAAIKQGEEFIIARGKKPVAKLTAVSESPVRKRPKVGEILDGQCVIPDSVFAPMTAEELGQWYGK